MRIAAYPRNESNSVVTHRLSTDWIQKKLFHQIVLSDFFWELNYIKMFGMYVVGKAYVRKRLHARQVPTTLPPRFAHSSRPIHLLFLLSSPPSSGG